METIAFPNLERVLTEYGQSARDTYRALLAQEKKTATGDLFNSVKFQVKRNGQTFEVGLDLAFYWKFIEGGSKGKKYPNALCRQHFPPVASIERWIVARRIVPKARGGKIPSVKSLAFLIARSISQNGIKPAPILKQSSDRVYRQFADSVADAFLKDVGRSVALELQVFHGL